MPTVNTAAEYAHVVSKRPRKFGAVNLVEITGKGW